MAFAPSNSVSQSFPNSIAEKLDDSNYLHWHQHIVPVIKSHRLQRFIVNPVIPPCYLTEDDRIDDHVNPDYEGSNAPVMAAIHSFKIGIIACSWLKSFLSSLGKIHE